MHPEFLASLRTAMRKSSSSEPFRVPLQMSVLLFFFVERLNMFNRCFFFLKRASSRNRSALDVRLCKTSGLFDGQVDCNSVWCRQGATLENPSCRRSWKRCVGQKKNGGLLGTASCGDTLTAFPSPRRWDSLFSGGASAQRGGLQRCLFSLSLCLSP